MSANGDAGIAALLIEDNPGDARLIEALLDELPGEPVRLLWAARLGDGLERLAREPVDAVLLDLSLPDCQGLETLRRLQAADASVPIVILTGLIDETMAVQAVQAGAQDYLVKGQVSGELLSRALRYAVERCRAEQTRLELGRARAERAQVEEALRLRDEFLALVTHELKTPLTAIKAYSQLMRRRGAYSERSIDSVIAQADHLARLIDDLLEVSRLQTGRLELRTTTVDLVALARRVAEQAQASSQVHQIRVEAPAPVPPGEWDPDRLAQVLHNVLSNAVKYSPDGGEVLVRLRDVGETAEVSVRDHGAGIPAEALPRLFDRFYRVRETATVAPGLGLGLHITRGLVEAHGGRVAIDSTLGEGTTVTITLPYGGPLT